MEEQERKKREKGREQIQTSMCADLKRHVQILCVCAPVTQADISTRFQGNALL